MAHSFVQAILVHVYLSHSPVPNVLLVQFYMAHSSVPTVLAHVYMPILVHQLS